MVTKYLYRLAEGWSKEELFDEMKKEGYILVSDEGGILEVRGFPSDIDGTFKGKFKNEEGLKSLKEQYIDEVISKSPNYGEFKKDRKD